MVFPFVWGLALFVIVGLGTQNISLAKEEAVRLYEGLGKHHFRISTHVLMAQRYFDQGMILMYGFNHAEAARSFREAQKLDPTCGLCYWGEALVLGPNINAPMNDSAVPQAFAAVQRALALRENATGKERVLIQAVAKRYAKEVSADRSIFDVNTQKPCVRQPCSFPMIQSLGYCWLKT